MTDRIVDSAAPEERKNTEFMKGIPHSENSSTYTHTHRKKTTTTDLAEKHENTSKIHCPILNCTFSVEHEEMLIINDF